MATFLVTNARAVSRSRGALKEWAEANDGELVDWDRARRKARRDIEVFYDIHGRARVGWSARTSGLGISGATTLWIERRRKDNFIGGLRSDDDSFDGDYFIGGDGGVELGEVLHLPGFRGAVRTLFDRVKPVAVELDVDGNLIVRTGRGVIDSNGVNTARRHRRLR